MKFVKATKTQSYLKLGLAGPPGSGKSYTALNIATHLSEKRVAVIDAEAGAASKYAHLFDFDTLDLTVDDEGKDVAKPYSPLRYMEAIKSAYDSGDYDILIIDGISPEWDDAGGCLQWVDQITRNNDTRAAWKVVTPAHKQFINYILRVRMHVICTMLAKKEIVVEKDAQGRVLGKKVTLEPIQREDVPRVFDVFASMQNKEMILDKTRCPDLDDQIFHKPGKEVADILREWLKGDPMPERPEYAPALALSQMRLNSHPVEQESSQVPAQNAVKIEAEREREAYQEGHATDQQRAAIASMAKSLGIVDASSTTTTFEDARAKIAELQQQLRQRRAAVVSK